MTEKKIITSDITMNLLEPGGMYVHDSLGGTDDGLKDKPQEEGQSVLMRETTSQPRVGPIGPVDHGTGGRASS